MPTSVGFFRLKENMPSININDLNNAKADVEHIAAIATSPAPTATDRFGRLKLTLQGAISNIGLAADAVMAGLGYSPPVAYVAGLNMTLRSQTVEYAGNTYAPKTGDLPFVTTGNFEAAKFRLIQGIVFSDLIAPFGSALMGFIQVGVGVVSGTVQDKLREKVSAMDYMTKAERADVIAGTRLKDVTAAVQRAINATAAGGCLTYPPGSYAVTTVSTGRMEATWVFDRAELVAIATTTQACMLKFSGLHCTIYGMKLNGNFNLNYGALFWWYNDTDSSQHNSIFGLEIRYTKRGIVYGAQGGETSTGYAQSENVIYGLKTRGVERPLLMNHSNGVLFLATPMLAAHDEEWEAFQPNKFDRNTNFAFEANAGVLSIDGGEIQNSIAAVTSYCAVVGGGEVYLNGVITEVDAPFLLSGELTINGGRLLNTQSLTDQFVIAPSANSGTKLKVSNTKLFRNAGVGSFSNRRLVNNTGSATGIEILFRNCDISEWASFVPAVSSNHQSTHFDDVRWYPDGTKDSHESVFLLDTHGMDLLDRPSIDNTGRTSDGFYQGLWYGAGTTWSISADVPNGNYAGSLSCNAPGQAGYFTCDGTSLATLKATATRVKPGDKFMVECWIRFVGGTGQASASLWAFDAAGVALASNPFIEIFDENGFITGAWQYVRNVVTIPSGVAYVGFGAHGLQTEVRFCGLKVRRADWNSK